MERGERVKRWSKDGMRRGLVETEEAEDTELVVVGVWCHGLVRRGDPLAMKDWLEKGNPGSRVSSSG